jgi:hypothetical protein
MHIQFRWDLVTAVWAAIRVLEPLLKAFITEDMLAFGQTCRMLENTFRILNPHLVVANHACFSRSVKLLHGESCSCGMKALTSIRFFNILGVHILE